ALAFKVLVVLVQINEPWSNDQPLGGNHALACKGLSRDFLDLALANADIANGIQTCFGIDHAAALNYNIIALRQRQHGRKNHCQTQNENLHLLISREDGAGLMLAPQLAATRNRAWLYRFARRIKFFIASASISVRDFIADRPCVSLEQSGALTPRAKNRFQAFTVEV